MNDRYHLVLKTDDGHQDTEATGTWDVVAAVLNALTKSEWKVTGAVILEVKRI